ncbi:MAG: hypothetical protein HDR46_05745 [Bacteroides sp.]|nr:hypothetical protein [Bacteroides sp.]
METKKCPYCGGEIMLAAKKCKHCGEWLDEQTAIENPSISNTPQMEDINEPPKQPKRRKIIFGLAGSLVSIGLLVGLFVYYKYYKVSEQYDTKYTAIEKSLDYHIIRADGQKIWYVPKKEDDRYQPYGLEILEYDSKTDETNNIRLDTHFLCGEEYELASGSHIVEHNGVITVIIECNHRYNAVHVWQFNCYDHLWNALAAECQRAEFIHRNTAVKICDEEYTINPHACNAAQRHLDKYQIIRI